MSVFVDTSVWSLAFRRDQASAPEAIKLRSILSAGEAIFTTGLVLQELLQGFNGPTQKQTLIEHLDAVPFVKPRRDDYIQAADLRNKCRRSGVQIGTIDALFAQLCITHEFEMLSADKDFSFVAKHSGLKIVEL